MQSESQRARTPFSLAILEAQSALEFSGTEPDLLRDTVCGALSTLSIDDRSAFRKRLFGELREAGLRVRQSLFMLGVSAASAEELTAPEIAALIRYVRLAEPKAMTAVDGTLRELLTVANVEAGLSGKAA
jgi:hypothetical protein